MDVDINTFILKGRIKRVPFSATIRDKEHWFMIVETIIPVQNKHKEVILLKNSFRVSLNKAWARDRVSECKLGDTVRIVANLSCLLKTVKYKDKTVHYNDTTVVPESIDLYNYGDVEVPDYTDYLRKIDLEEKPKFKIPEK